MTSVARMVLIAATLGVCAHASRASEISLPQSARKLDAAGITDLYDGAYAAFDNKQNKETLTGDIFYDLAGGRMFGFYNWNNESKGLFSGRIWIKDDQFCNKPDKGKETCTHVYRDGRTYYEVSKDGKITSIDVLYDNPPKLPADAKKVTPAEFLDHVRGKRLFVAVFGFAKPVMVNIKHDGKKKRSSGSAVRAEEKEGKLSVNFSVKGGQICWPDPKGKVSCFDHHLASDGIYQTDASGRVHSISKIQ